MQKLKSKLIALLLAIGAITGLGLVTATPAQAFGDFYYTADCPGTAAWQQLVVRDQNSGDTVVVHQLNWRTYVPNGTALAYIKVVNADTYQYRFSGNGNLNWYYHVYCGYVE